MIRALYSASSGMKAQQTAIDVISNNLANVNTTGYKKVRANIQSLLSQTERAPGTSTSVNTRSPSGIQIGLGARVASTQKEFSLGPVKPTGNGLDAAIMGDGFFQVTIPPAGQIGYTRDGAFHTDDTGQLVTTQGYLVEPAITIPQGVVNVAIGTDGTITGQQDGLEINIGQLQTASFVNPAGLLSAGGNLLQASGSSGQPVVGNPGENGTGELAGGALEGANVQAVEEMINLIAAQRAFEFNSKAVQASDQMLREIGQLR